MWKQDKVALRLHSVQALRTSEGAPVWTPGSQLRPFAVDFYGALGKNTMVENMALKRTRKIFTKLVVIAKSYLTAPNIAGLREEKW